jgi:hypothetical protein
MLFRSIVIEQKKNETTNGPCKEEKINEKCESKNEDKKESE